MLVFVQSKSPKVQPRLIHYFRTTMQLYVVYLLKKKEWYFNQQC